MKHTPTTNIHNDKRKSILPQDFYQKLFEAENNFQSYPSMQSCEHLLLIYKQGAEYFGNLNAKEHNYFINAIQKTISAQMTTKILSNKNDLLYDSKNFNKYRNIYAVLVNYGKIEYIQTGLENCDDDLHQEYISYNYEVRLYFLAFISS